LGAERTSYFFFLAGAAFFGATFFGAAFKKKK
jgi:LPXTG-motif cell wall-anchored protein